MATIPGPSKMSRSGCWLRTSTWSRNPAIRLSQLPTSRVSPPARSRTWMWDTRCTLPGPAGTGKTTLALHVASKRGRPVVLIHGDDEYASSDLVGKDSGYRKSKLVDNYIHSVVRTEESLNRIWEDQRLTTACIKGYTLIYDEFNRSRPEANNVLLSVLEGKILNLPNLRRSGEGNLHVHEEFRAILTSNPEEYAGVHKTQDALLDRLITMNLGHLDRETEVAIAMAKSGLPASGCGNHRRYHSRTAWSGGEQPSPHHPSGDRHRPNPRPPQRLGPRSATQPLRRSATMCSIPTPQKLPTRASP